MKLKKQCSNINFDGLFDTFTTSPIMMQNKKLDLKTLTLKIKPKHVNLTPTH
jgi:hypothetical protein